MIDINLIREEPQVVKDNMIKKGYASTSIVDSVSSSDKEWRELKKQVDDLRAERNKVSKEINALKKAGKDATEALTRAKSIPNEIRAIEDKIEKQYNKIQSEIKKIPNIMHESVPIGKDDSENPVIKEWGDITVKDFEVKNHVELAEELCLADFERATNLSGNGFYLLKGDLGLLNQALIRFTLDHMQKKNYTYVEVPLMIRKHVLDAAMDTEEFSDTIYKVQDENLNLIGTSEHALLGLHEDELIEESKLPKKYFSYSMCFRKEIGSHGINEKGLWRTHQFNKVEQFIFCDPEESYKLYDELLQNTEELFQALELPYRVVECCTGDLALWKAKSSDIEVYRPTTKDYGEVTSLSNCTDFQARGLNTRVLKKDNTKKVLHTLNNTAIATSRALVAIMENYQNKDGSITIPKVLQKYMFGKTVISKLS